MPASSAKCQEAPQDPCRTSNKFAEMPSAERGGAWLPRRRPRSQLPEAAAGWVSSGLTSSLSSAPSSAFSGSARGAARLSQPHTGLPAARSTPPVCFPGVSPSPLLPGASWNLPSGISVLCSVGPRTSLPRPLACPVVCAGQDSLEAVGPGQSPGDPLLTQLLPCAVRAPTTPSRFQWGHGACHPWCAQRAQL